MQQIKIFPLYLKYPLFKIDLEYLKTYYNKNPYLVCKQYFKNEPKHIQYSYGETWPSSVPQFVTHLPLTSQDVLYDLGSGTGRVSFWFQKISGCEVVAIEKVPLFIENAQKIQKKLGLEKVTFLEEDILNIDYSRATIIYFYGTSFSDTFIKSLIEKWRTLKEGTRILTTSFHLNEYLDKPAYQVKKQYQVSYPWGICDVYLQEKI